MLDITKECSGANRIGITGHINPDGDCVGAVMAMWQFLKKVYPQKTIYVLLEKPSAEFSMIEGVSEIIPMDDKTVYPDEIKEQTFDIMIVLDTVIDRCGRACPFIESAGKVINIDHHISNPGQGDLNEIDPEASAASEIVYELVTLTDAHRAYLDREMAQTLYIGIINDTGVMQYSNTSPKTLCIVADLISFGFDFPKLIDATFYERTPLQSKLTGMALESVDLLLDGKAAVSVFSFEKLKKLGASKQDMGGIVSQLRYIKGVEVAVFLYGIKPKMYKVSLRSCGDVDVAKICAKYGGGGHMRAAGCNVEGKAEDIVAGLIADIAEQV